MEHLDDLTITNSQLDYLTGKQFTDWKEKNIDTRKEYHLTQAIIAANLFTLEGQSKACQHLLMYSEYTRMTDSEILSLQVAKVQLEEEDKQQNPYRVQG